MDNEPVRNVTQLIRKAREGDPACRDELFGLCRDYLHFIARAEVESWLRVKVDASDVVQQTMLEAHRDFERFSGDSEKEWLGWLRRILSHNVADFVRHYRGTAKRQQRREVPIRRAGSEIIGQAGVQEPAGRGGTPSQELIRLDDELCVAAAIAEMPKDYREVIMLRNFQRLQFSEIAEQMDRSRPAVQMLWMRAIKRLQVAIEDPNGDDGDGGDESAGGT